jgi:hypothetical protein
VNKILYLVLSSLNCPFCYDEGEDLEQFHQAHEADHVIVVEMLADATSAQQLTSWQGSFTHQAIAGTPDPSQAHDDCINGGTCGSVPHHALIDLTTMKILNADCYPNNDYPINPQDWEDCVAPYL